MARQQGVKTLLQCVYIQGAVQAQGGGDVIRRALRVKLPHKPLALLRVRQLAGLIL